MPIVAPKVKVIRVSDVPRGDPIIINPSTGQPYPRFGPYVDLGVIDVTKIAINGFIELMPFVAGMVNPEIYFTVDNYVPQNSNFDIYFTNPGTLVETVGLGLAKLPTGGGNPLDTIWFISQSQDPVFRYTGPLYLAFTLSPGSYVSSWAVWAANSPYALGEYTQKNGFYQNVTTGGISGDSEPTWNDTPNGTTNDGTVQWTNQGALPTLGRIHAHAVVNDQAVSEIHTIGSLQFIQQPTDVVAGATITPSITVKVLDENGDPFLQSPVLVQLAILGAGTLGGSGAFGVYTDQTTGIATIDVSIAEAANGYILRARASYSINIAPVDSDPFNVT